MVHFQELKRYSTFSTWCLVLKFKIRNENMTQSDIFLLTDKGLFSLNRLVVLSKGTGIKDNKNINLYECYDTFVN